MTRSKRSRQHNRRRIAKRVSEMLRIGRRVTPRAVEPIVYEPKRLEVSINVVREDIKVHR
jgi:hypothetical protein